MAFNASELFGQAQTITTVTEEITTLSNNVSESCATIANTIGGESANLQSNWNDLSTNFATIATHFTNYGQLMSEALTAYAEATLANEENLVMDLQTTMAKIEELAAAISNITI